MTFDPTLFLDVLDTMDSFYIAQKISGIDLDYFVINDGQNSCGYIHKIVLHNIKMNTGCSLFLYENQSLKLKGYFRFQINDPKFDLRQNNLFLKSLGITKYDKKKKGNRWVFAIYLNNFEQLAPLIAHYSKYIL